MAGSFVCERRQRLAVCGIRPGLSRGAAACLRSWGRRWARFPFMSMTIDCTVCGRLPAWQTHTSVSATPLPAFRGRQILSGLLHSLVLAGSVDAGCHPFITIVNRSSTSRCLANAWQTSDTMLAVNKSWAGGLAADALMHTSSTALALLNRGCGGEGSSTSQQAQSTSRGVPQQ